MSVSTMALELTDMRLSTAPLPDSLRGPDADRVTRCHKFARNCTPPPVMPSRSRHMSPYPDLNNRVALVTGASRGIGAAIATALADAGAAVAVNYRERAAEADKVAGAIRQRGRRAITVEADVSQSTAVSRMIERVTAELGPIDILINNAGVGLNRTIDTADGGRFRPHDRGEPEVGVPLHTGCPARHASAQVGPHRQYLVRRGARSRRSRPALQCFESRTGGTDTRLRGARRQGRNHRQRRRSDNDRDRDDARTRGAGGAHSVGRLGHVDEVAQAVLMVIGNAFMTGQTVQINGGTNFI